MLRRRSSYSSTSAGLGPGRPEVSTAEPQEAPARFPARVLAAPAAAVNPMFARVRRSAIALLSQAAVVVAAASTPKDSDQILAAKVVARSATAAAAAPNVVNTAFAATVAVVERKALVEQAARAEVVGAKNFAVTTVR